MPFTRFSRFTVLLVTLLTLTAASLFAAGEPHDGKVSAYLRGAYMTPDAAEAKLKSAGFEVLGKDQITPELTSVLFTCPTLKKMANQPKRGFVGAMRLLSNKKENEITVTNPLYFAKAYMQKAYDDAAAHKVLSKLNSALPGLKDSRDALKSGDLAGYHFTFGMPYYEDMEKVASGAHDALLQKAKATGNVTFELPLAKDRTLIGYKLSDKTAKFVNKIGTKNAVVLPYAILIEGDKAYILAPKYYLALSYPQLKMTQFMTIATTPGKITKECKAAFK